MNPLTVLRDAFHFFSRHLPSIAPLCLPLIAAECLARAVVAGLVDTDHSPAYELLVGLFFYPLYSAALILFLDARSQGQRPSTRNLLAAALPLWPSFAVLAGLSTLLIMLGGALFLPVALYLMVKLAFSEYLLESADVAVVPGSAFGDMGEGYLRLVFANSDENLKEAVRRIADYVARAYPGIK